MLCTTKENINKMKRQSMYWEKIRGNDVTDKELVSKIYKHLIELNIKTKQNNTIKKKCADLTR